MLTRGNDREVIITFVNDLIKWDIWIGTRKRSCSSSCLLNSSLKTKFISMIDLGELWVTEPSDFYESVFYIGMQHAMDFMGIPYQD